MRCTSDSIGRSVARCRVAVRLPHRWRRSRSHRSASRLGGVDRVGVGGLRARAGRDRRAQPAWRHRDPRSPRPRREPDRGRACGLAPRPHHRADQRSAPVQLVTDHPSARRLDGRRECRGGARRDQRTRPARRVDWSGRTALRSADRRRSSGRRTTDRGGEHRRGLGTVDDRRVVHRLRARRSGRDRRSRRRRDRVPAAGALRGRHDPGVRRDSSAAGGDPCTRARQRRRPYRQRAGACAAHAQVVDSRSCVRSPTATPRSGASTPSRSKRPVSVGR